MSKYILNINENIKTYHINGDRLDNRKCNLTTIKPRCKSKYKLCENYAIVYTNKNEEILIDKDDIENVTQYTWYIQKNGYVARKTKKNRMNKTIYLHRSIYGITCSKEVDHINRNKLDNRKENLRVCNHIDNQHNMKPATGLTSKYKGVCWDKRRKAWRMRLKCNDKEAICEYYKNEISAANAYNYWAKIYFGEFAYVNKVEEMTYEECKMYKLTRRTSSQYKGISYNKKTNKWRARIICNGNEIHIGVFPTEEEAVIAYNKKAIELFGEEAKLNITETN